MSACERIKSFFYPINIWLIQILNCYWLVKRSDIFFGIYCCWYWWTLKIGSKRWNSSNVRSHNLTLIHRLIVSCYFILYLLNLTLIYLASSFFTNSLNTHCSGSLLLSRNHIIILWNFYWLIQWIIFAWLNYYRAIRINNLIRKVYFLWLP